MLYLPSGPVGMEAAPVHRKPLDWREPRKGYFSGTQINPNVRFDRYEASVISSSLVFILTTFLSL